MYGVVKVKVEDANRIVKTSVLTVLFLQQIERPLIRSSAGTYLTAQQDWLDVRVQSIQLKCMFKANGLDQRFHKNCVVRKSSPSLEEAKDQHFDLYFNCSKLLTMIR